MINFLPACRLAQRISPMHGLIVTCSNVIHNHVFIVQPYVDCYCIGSFIKSYITMLDCLYVICTFSIFTFIHFLILAPPPPPNTNTPSPSKHSLRSEIETLWVADWYSRKACQLQYVYIGAVLSFSRRAYQHNAHCKIMLLSSCYFINVELFNCNFMEPSTSTL